MRLCIYTVHLNVIVGFRLHKAGVPRPNPEFISVPLRKKVREALQQATEKWYNVLAKTY